MMNRLWPKEQRRGGDEELPVQKAKQMINMVSLFGKKWMYSRTKMFA
jgi:hypothetical protein